MEKNIFAVYDPDPEFVFRFLEYAKSRGKTGMDLRAFTAPEHLDSMCRQTPPELLLVSSSVLTEEVKKFPAKKKVLLQEDRETEPEDMPAVYKYQSTEELLRQVLSFREEQQSYSSPGGRKGGRMKMIGVYSPVGRTRKTSFALTMGQILARNRAVLYLNLETFAGFEQLFQEQYERTLSDLLYFGRQEGAALGEQLPGITRSIDNLDLVPPVLSPEDLQSVKPEEWMDLFQKLREQTGYEVLLLDLGEAVQGLTELIAACDRIYMPVRKDPMSLAKEEQFLWVLERLEGKEACGKIRRVLVPFCQNHKTGREFFKDLVWSELGDLVRSELSEEKPL